MDKMKFLCYNVKNMNKERGIIMKIKKIISIFLAAMTLSAFAGFGYYAAFAEDNITVTVNGNKLNFDQPPIIKDGRTLVPLRAIFEALGAEVLWMADDQAIAAQSGDTTIVMQIGKNQFGKMTSNDDGVMYDLDVPPEIINGRTLVPARAVAEALDCSVNWDGNTQTVTISSEKWIDGANSPTNAYIHNGVVYYSFIYQPYIYAYDGSTTKTYAAGGAPLGIVVNGNRIYYINKDNQTVCAINMANGERETVFARLSSISDFSVCGDKMVIMGFDGDTQNAYRLDLTSGNAEIIYTRPDKEGLFAEKQSTFALWKQYLFVIESFSPLLEGESNCKILMIDTESGAVQEACNIKGIVTQLSLKDSSYTHRYNGAAVKFGSDNAYFALQFTSSEDTSNFNNTENFTEYYKISLANGTMTEITEAEFEGAQNLAANITGEWTYGSDESKVYRTNTQSGITETLLSGEDYYYITNDAQWVVVLKAESAGSGTPTATKGYKYAEMYVMNTDGNNLQTINSYNNSSNTSSPTGEINTETLAPEACAVCGGSGMVTCSYCRGTGKGQTISVIGMPTEQGCTYCGSTGKKLCPGCNGSGQK